MVLNIIDSYHTSSDPNYATFLNRWHNNIGGRDSTLKIRKRWGNDAVIRLNKYTDKNKVLHQTVQISANGALTMTRDEFATFVQAMNEAFNLLDKE